jgi:hypothetical protein
MHNNQYDGSVNVRCYREPSMSKVKRNHWKEEKGSRFRGENKECLLVLS